MKKFLLGLSLLALLQTGCTGSGAVNPLTPTKASQPDPSMAASDSDTIYWTSFPVTFGLTDTLTGACIVSKKLAWACGNNGVVLRYDGDTWAKVDTGLAKNQNFYAIQFANENEGWVVGSQGTILHYNNGNWNLDPSPTQQNLYGLAVTRAKTVWAVGSNGTILNYNGIAWAPVTATGTEAAGSGGTNITTDIYSIGMSSQNNGWAVGNQGLILKYDNQKWQAFAGNPSTEKLSSVSVISDVQAWAVGAFGTILRFNGTTWTKVTNPFSGFDLYQVAMKSDDDGWAIGQDGTIIYYDGTRWISHQKPDGKPALNGIAFYNDIGFIVGQNGTILKFQSKGLPAQYDFLFKGEVTKKPTKANPCWTFTYTLMNQSPKTSPPVTFVLPLPKGFELYQKKDQPLSNPAAMASPQATAVVQATATPTVTSTPTPIAPGSLTPTTKPAVKTASAVAWNGKVKDNNLEWEVGTVAASEMKSLTVTLQEKKKEKKEYPVVLKAYLRSGDKAIAEAAPVTVIKSEEAAPSVAIQPATTPSTLKKDSPQGNGPANVQPTPTPGS